MTRYLEAAGNVLLFTLTAWVARAEPPAVTGYHIRDELTLGPSTQRGPFAEVFYENHSGGDAVVQGTYAMDWNGIVVDVTITLQAHNGNEEGIFVRPRDPNLVAWPEEAFLRDGEHVRVQIIGPMF